MTDGLQLRRQKVAEMVGKQERRIFGGDLELRDTDSGGVGLVGWACLTDVEYEIGDPKRSGFVEVVRRGSFRRTLQNAPDVILVLNHGDAGSGLPIARTKSGTMRLAEDGRGLRVDADLNPNDPDVQLLREKMTRGDLDGQMSFAFRVPSGGDSWSKDFTRREITTCEINGGDVSVVTFAASPTTSSQLVARAWGEPVSRPMLLPDYLTSRRARLAVLRSGRVGSSQPALSQVVTPAGGRSTESLRARVAQLRRAA